MQRYHCKNILGIEIVAATKSEVHKVSAALRFLKTRNVKALKTLQMLRAILVFPKLDYDNTLLVKEKIYICQRGTVLGASTQYLASLLVHEVRHLEQYKRDIKFYGDVAERDAYRIQRQFLKKYSTKEELDWLAKLFKERWWIFKDVKGRKTLVSPDDKRLRKFAQRYLKNKLKCKPRR